MKQLITTVMALTLTINICLSQNKFDLISLLKPEPKAEFIDLTNGNLSYGDVNNDGNIDILLTGKQNSAFFPATSALYLGNSNGKFTLNENPIYSVFNNQSQFVDIDSDGDLDLFLSGKETWFHEGTKFLINDGNGNYSFQNILNPISELYGGGSQFGDLDNDNDQDLIYTGYYGSNVYLKVFLNDSSGVFIEDTSMTINGIYNGDLKLVDVDNDGDLDFILAGYNSNQNSISQLYLNTNGNFQLSNNVFEGLHNCKIEIIDIDNDNDDDIIFVGKNDNNISRFNIYLNNSIGQYSLISNNINPLIDGTFSFGKLNNDNYYDLFISGLDSNNNRLTETYFYTTTGQYIKTSNSIVNSLHHSSLLYDFDNDGYDDLILNGEDSDLYINDGLGNLTIKGYSELIGLAGYTATYSDVDNDGDNDLFYSGKDRNQIEHSYLYLNNGNGDFNLSVNTFKGLYNGNHIFGDLDQDGDNDLITTGIDSTNTKYCLIYDNNGSGIFSLRSNSNLIGSSENSIYLEDIDGDNDKDLIISGTASSGSNSLLLYLNNGLGSFTIDQTNNFQFLNNSSIAVGDIDNDGDMDIYYTGSNHIPTNQTYSYLYINNGTGSFTTQSSNSIQGANSAFSEFVDIDNDSDLDLYIYGQTPLNNTLEAKVYKNDGTGTFAHGINLYGNQLYSKNRLADLNGDQLPDLIGRYDTYYKEVSYIFYADSTNNYLVGDTLLGTEYGGSIFFDIDGDNDLDIFTMGDNNANKVNAFVFRNNFNNLVQINESNVKTNEVILYPNPVSEQLTIELPMGNKFIEVYDISGKLLDQFKLSNLVYQYNMSNFLSGMYLFKVTHNQESSFFKIIK
jgi:hypothetical protein